MQFRGSLSEDKGLRSRHAFNAPYLGGIPSRNVWISTDPYGIQLNYISDSYACSDVMWASLRPLRDKHSVLNE
jgi:hypothetical protein